LLGFAFQAVSLSAGLDGVFAEVGGDGVHGLGVDVDEGGGGGGVGVFDFGWGGGAGLFRALLGALGSSSSVGHLVFYL